VLEGRDRVRRQLILFVGGARTEDLSLPIPHGAELHIVGALPGG